VKIFIPVAIGVAFGIVAYCIYYANPAPWRARWAVFKARRDEDRARRHEGR
jgi:hypothetical protein